jgi:regulator of protease activity HflC (stomatin/prohibitin superfamily)
MTISLLTVVIVFLIIILSSAIRVLREYERGVVFRLGRLIGAKGPGLIFLIPIVDRMVKVSLRTVVLDVPPQDVITRDNVSIKVNAVVYFRVVDPEKAIVEVEDYLYATSQLSQTTLRSVLGQSELDEILAEREKINQNLQQIIDAHTDSWGIKVSMVEIKHVDLPVEMQRAYQAAQRLAEAAQIIGQYPTAIQLRFLQTLSEVASERNSTTIFPIPIELIRPFIETGDKKK